MYKTRKQANKEKAYRLIKKQFGIFAIPVIFCFALSLPLLFLLKYLGVALVYVGEKLERLI